MKSFPRFLLLLLAACAAAQTQPAPPATPVSPQAITPAASALAAREIRGTVKAGNVPLPGVTITAANTLTGKKVATSTGLDGVYTLVLPANGRYVVRAELAAFAPATQDVLINAANPKATIDLGMQLASRVQQQEQNTNAAIAQAASALSGRGMQSLGVNSGDAESFAAGTAGGNASQSETAGGSGQAGGLPLSGGEGASESVSISGAMGRTQGALSQDELEDRMSEMRDQMTNGGGGGGGSQARGGAGGGGAGGGGFGGGGAGGIMVLGGAALRNFNINRPHGMLYYQSGNSIFDASPYSLTGAPTAKPQYDQNRFGAILGGPLNIPHIFNGGAKTFFFLNFTGGLNSNPFDAFSTVPTLAERNGDFSQAVFTSGPNRGLPVQIFDPATHQQFAGNAIPAGMITSQAKALLALIPLPNLPGDSQNFHQVTSTTNNLTNVNARIIHNFGETPNILGQRPAGGGGRGGGGGRRGGRRRTTNLNLGFNYSHATNDIANAIPALGGSTDFTGLNFNAGLNISRGRLNDNLNFTYNRSDSQTSNKYAFKQDVAGMAGINGVSQDPFDFGVPQLSFTNFRSLNDVSSSQRLGQTFSISDGVGWTRGKHSLRVGGDFRRIFNDIRSDQNARGAFTFTGFATSAAAPGTGYDFADFLLGLPQLTSIQSGALRYNLRGNSWDVYVQDEWRMRANFTVNLGLRYEYVSPFSEADNRLVNLDVSPGFTAVAPVQPDATGPFTGSFPVTLVNPDRNNWAPRVGIAWKPFKNTVVRSGYGINYNLGQYAALAQQLAFQPPFAFTETNVSTPAAPLTLANGFIANPTALTNNYAVNRDYKLAYVQVWNLDIQQEIHRTWLLNIGYNGSKGTDLDIVRAPNRLANGTLRIPGVQPFYFESSEGDSTFQAATLRLRKRLRGGFSASGAYTYSKSLDNASSIGGGATVVAQNDLDLAAERGLSSFDQRHKFTGNYIFELPFGPNKKFLAADSLASRLLREWQLSSDFTIGSGTPFTARVVGSFTDVASGVNGTLRANYNGAPIQLDHPVLVQRQDGTFAYDHFNTAAFSLPVPGQFGNAARNSIIGPATVAFNMAVSKTITMRDFQALEFRFSASNVFNSVHFTSIDTVVNSPTFGQVLAAGPMRRVQLLARYRF